MLIWNFSINLDIYDHVGKLPEQHFSVWLFFNPGDKILLLLKFYEARISEWNICFHNTSQSYLAVIHVTPWVLSLLCSYLSRRSMRPCQIKCTYDCHLWSILEYHSKGMEYGVFLVSP